MKLKKWVLVLLAAPLLGCSTNGQADTFRPTGPMTVTAALEQISAEPNQPVNVLAHATVPTESGPVALPNIVVNFVVVEGGGKVFAGSSLTNQQGEAKEVWTLGPSPGTHVLEVRSVDQTTGQPLVHTRVMIVAAFAPAKVPRRPLSAGYNHTCGITADGVAYCWGQNDQGQLGFYSDNLEGTHSTPTPVSSDSLRFAAISAGGAHTCALTSIGEAWCWGRGTIGQLGDGNMNLSPLPVRVRGGLRFTSISAGLNHTCGAATDGKAYCWGYGEFGQIGDGAKQSRTVPTPVTGLVGVKAVHAGEPHSCALTAEGAVYCWGAGSWGELGNGSPSFHSTTPVPVTGGLVFSQLGGGFYKTCTLTGSGAAYCWGRYESQPTVVPGNHTFTMVEGGGREMPHSCGISDVGDTYCWGQNDQGQLGTGTNENAVEPLLVSGAARFTSLEPGGSHTCALTAAGVAYCWGSNAYGKLGVADLTASNVPVEVSTSIRFQ